MSSSGFYSDLSDASVATGLSERGLLRLLLPQDYSNFNLSEKSDDRKSFHSLLFYGLPHPFLIEMSCRHSCCHCTVADDSSPHGIASLSLSIGLKGTTGLSLKETDSLRSRAMEIKRLMRVQMADEEDLLSVSLAYSLCLSHIPFHLLFFSLIPPFSQPLSLSLITRH